MEQHLRPRRRTVFLRCQLFPPRQGSLCLLVQAVPSMVAAIRLADLRLLITAVLLVVRPQLRPTARPLRCQHAVCLLRQL